MSRDSKVTVTNNQYLNFLCNVVGRAYEYDKLLEHLHGIEFYSLVPNDDNRGVDGEQLRTIFIDEVGPQGSTSLPKGRCSVLEMLIGVSYRLEFELLGGRYERPACDWFWVLIENLELEWCDNVLYSRLESVREVDERVKNLLERRYGTDGRGGLFPLKVARQDQRRIEIWYQMSAWVIENYPI